MNIRLFISCAVTICTLYVNAGTENEEQQKIPEKAVTKIVTDYANAWIAGNIEKMYACYQPTAFSFADFQKSLSNLISAETRPKRLVAVGKPYYINARSMWAVNYTLRFNINGAQEDKHYRSLISEIHGNYVLRVNMLYFSEKELDSIKATVERVLTGWEKDDTDNLAKMFINGDNPTVKKVFLSLCKSIAKTDHIVPITHYQFNEPTEWSPGDIANVYPEVSISESKATLKFLLSRQQGTADNWVIDRIALSAPYQARAAILATVGAYLRAWMKGDAQKMYKNFYGIKGNPQDVFGSVTQESEIPLDIRSVKQPLFPALDTALVNYLCMFKNKNEKSKGAIKFRQARLKDINGKWLIVTDGVLSPDDNRSVELQVQTYVTNWIAKNPEGMYKCFKANVVTLSNLENKVKDDAEKALIPQKFVRFLNTWSDNQDTVNIGFEVADKSGTTSDYQAKLSRVSGSDWLILCITDYPDQQTTELLKEKAIAYVDAWMKGDSAAILKCYEGIETDGHEINFLRTVKAQFELEPKPMRLLSMGKPSYVSESNWIKVPYVMECKGGQLVCFTTFKFNEETHTWVYE